MTRASVYYKQPTALVALRRYSHVLCLVAAALCARRAYGDDLADNASNNPVLAHVPRVGELAVHTGQAALYEPATGWAGVWTMGAAWGLPLIQSVPLKLRLELPVLELGSRVQGGSLLGAFGLARQIASAGPFQVNASFELGAIAPSFGGATLAVAGNALAEHDSRLYYGAAIPVMFRPLALALVFWSTPFAGVNFELDYTVLAGAITLRAGMGVPIGDQEGRWLGGIGLRLAALMSLGFSVSAASDPSDGTVMEMSVRWSLPTQAVRTVPWGDADARVLHFQDVDGRSVVSVAVPGKFTIIEFGADWCAPCHDAHPRLETFARRPNVAVRLIDVDECPEFAARYQVRAIPTFFVLDPAGVVIRRIEGWNQAVLDSIVPR